MFKHKKLKRRTKPSLFNEKRSTFVPDYSPFKQYGTLKKIGKNDKPPMMFELLSEDHANRQMSKSEERISMGNCKK
jgi:hypothetical protein